MKGRRITYSDAELAWIEANSTRPRAEMHAAFVDQFYRDDVSMSNLAALCKRRGWLTGRNGRFSPGQVSWNKGRSMPHHPNSAATRFRPGHRGGRAAELHQPIGTERLTKEGYLQRKVNDDLPMHRRWRMVHVIEWERVNGPVPDGHCLKCIDGDRLNTDPDNWLLIPRGLLPRLNSRWNALNYDDAEPELKPYLLALARLRHTAAERRKARKDAALPAASHPDAPAGRRAPSRKGTLA